jgi:toxin FitB
VILILDTNVVSELMRAEPDSRVLAWIAAQKLTSLAATTITIMEIRFGLARLPLGRRRTSLEGRFEELLRRGMADRILAFDEPAARQAALIRAEREANGLPAPAEDCMIAGIARASGATVATRDRSGFAGSGVPVVDPWEQ